MVILFSPMMPHLAEECWAALKKGGLVAEAAWPQVEAALLVENTITLPVQINGKKRADVTVSRDAVNAEIERAVLELEAVRAGARGEGPQKSHRRPAEDRECGGVILSALLLLLLLAR